MPTTVNSRGVLLASFRNGEKPVKDAVGGGISFDNFNKEGNDGAGGGGASGAGMSGASSMLDASESMASRGSGSGEPRTPESASSRRSRRGGEEQISALRGDQTMLLLRIKGQVHPLETCSLLLGRGPLLGAIDSFIVPPVPPFIPPLAPDVASKPEISLYVPSKVDFTLSNARHAEVRNVGEEVLFDLFRSLLESFPVTEYTREVMGMTPAAATREPSQVPRVASTVGVFFGDICTPRQVVTTAADTVDDGEAAETCEVAPIAPPTGAASTESLPLLLLGERPLVTSDLSATAFSPMKRQREEERRRKEALMEASARAAFADLEFVSMVNDILNNTMFNLMQEAAFDEFSIYSDPLKFMTKNN